MNEEEKRKETTYKVLIFTHNMTTNTILPFEFTCSPMYFVWYPLTVFQLNYNLCVQFLTKAKFHSHIQLQLSLLVIMMYVVFICQNIEHSERYNWDLVTDSANCFFLPKNDLFYLSAFLERLVIICFLTGWECLLDYLW